LLKCDTCNLPKPENCHHCAACNKCIINLDHHCPWINNCVGFNNHRYFLLFLFYAWSSCTFYLGWALPVVFSDKYANTHLPTRMMTSVILSGSMGVTLFCFNLWSWYLALSDQTFLSIVNERRRLLNNQGGGGELRQARTWNKEFIKFRLKHIFGTDSWVQVFMPSRRDVEVNPFDLSQQADELINENNMLEEN